MRHAGTSSGNGDGACSDSPRSGGTCSDGTSAGAAQIATLAGRGARLFSALSQVFSALSQVLRARSPRLLALALAAALVSACASDSRRPIRPFDDLHDPNPSIRSQAVSEAARRGDDKLIPELIELLDDEDAAVRLTAGQALRDLTGRDSGYRAYAPAPELRRQVQDWRAWRASQPASADSAAPAAPRSCP